MNINIMVNIVLLSILIVIIRLWSGEIVLSPRAAKYGAAFAASGVAQAVGVTIAPN